MQFLLPVLLNPENMLSCLLAFLIVGIFLVPNWIFIIHCSSSDTNSLFLGLSLFASLLVCLHLFSS